MLNKKIKFIFVVIAIILSLALIFFLKPKKTAEEEVKEIKPAVGVIQAVISTTGMILPKNRLEVRPPVNGRLDKILAAEGEKVKSGQIIAWMSSTERAALLDAARGKGDDSFKYWQEAYKPIPLVSPIEGEVIVSTTQPGQTVTTSDPVIVLSDHLIARAQVDETDIGKIREGQEALITMDAYPDTKIPGKVEHIYYESKIINNVTVYEVDVLPESVPLFLRSGMNASIDFKEKAKEGVLLIPIDAVQREKSEAWVMVKEEADKEAVKRAVKLGISDEKNVEIVSGLSENDKVIIKSKKYALPTNNTGTNPFVPNFRRR